MKKLGQILDVTRQLSPPTGMRRHPITQQQWVDAVGSRVASRTQPLRLDRGVLYVRAATAAWANELSMLADTILEQLRSLDIEADAVRFSVGPVSYPKPRERQAAETLPQEPPRLPEELRELVARVQSPELRRAIAHAATKNLAGGSSRPAADGSRRATETTVPDRAPESVTQPVAVDEADED